MVCHSGGIDGFRSLTTLFPREEIGMVVLSNMGQFNIPEMLTYHIVERLLNLDETSWSERFMKEHLSSKEAEQEGKAQSAAKRIVGAGPSHPLESYNGDFEHPGYGMLSVTLAEGQLQGTFNGITIPIRHYHYDIFDVVWEIGNEELKASFLTNVKGDVDTLMVPFEPTGNDIVFKRVPDKRMRERAFLEQFVGVYEFLEMPFVVFLKIRAYPEPLCAWPARLRVNALQRERVSCQRPLRHERRISAQCFRYGDRDSRDDARWRVSRVEKG
jgi:hypothetical protein